MTFYNYPCYCGVSDSLCVISLSYCLPATFLEIMDDQTFLDGPSFLDDHYSEMLHHLTYKVESPLLYKKFMNYLYTNNVTFNELFSYYTIGNALWLRIMRHVLVGTPDEKEEGMIVIRTSVWKERLR